MFANGSFLYDGTAHSHAIAGTLPAGTSVSYAGNSRTEAGSQTITATILGRTNFEDSELTAILTILPSVRSLAFDPLPTLTFGTLWMVTAVLLIGTALQLHGQQPLTHTHHGQLCTVINSATSLMRMDGEVSVIGRRQWVGMEGAPTVFWGNGHIGLQRAGATGGVTIRHESMAVEKLTEASVFFAKSVRISATEYLGL